MNQALERIAEINSAAAGIMEEAAAQKSAMEQDFARRTKELDDQIAQDMEEKLTALKASLLETSGRSLEQAERRADAEIEALEKTYRNEKAEILEALFQAVLGKEGYGKSSDL